MLHRLLLAALIPLVLMLPMRPPSASAQPPSPAATTAADPDIARIQAYLNGLRSLKAHFVQVAPNGAVTQGTAWIQRPGRMRFQYNSPTPFFLVADHGSLIFHDAALRQTSNIPLWVTPLGVLLADHISLSGDVTVTGVNRLPGEVELTLLRTAHPHAGNLTLVFSDDPLTLRQWTVTDAQGRRTTVTLTDIELGGTFDQSLFDFLNPQFFQPNSQGGQTSGGNG